MAGSHPGLKLPVTFDSWYTQPDFCHYLDHTLGLAYVGTWTVTPRCCSRAARKSWVRLPIGSSKSIWRHCKQATDPVFRPITIPYKGEKEQYYSYCATHRIHNFGKQRLVINYRQADLSDAPVFYISNRLEWQAAGITRIRRHRWPVEVYHEEGKAEGLDQYQLRDFSAIATTCGFGRRGLQLTACRST